ncbi:hypothetical protein CAI21_21930 [Alkalilimnicola ehrlichii]|nr:hypothetical protein CAI21_21930 [Alkalilimnicola ehrlichii]
MANTRRPGREPLSPHLLEPRVVFGLCFLHLGAVALQPLAEIGIARIGNVELLAPDEGKAPPIPHLRRIALTVVRGLKAPPQLRINRDAIDQFLRLGAVLGKVGLRGRRGVHGVHSVKFVHAQSRSFTVLWVIGQASRVVFDQSSAGAGCVKGGGRKKPAPLPGRGGGRGAGPGGSGFHRLPAFVKPALFQS